MDLYLHLIWKFLIQLAPRKLSSIVHLSLGFVGKKKLDMLTIVVVLMVLQSLYNLLVNGLWVILNQVLDIKELKMFLPLNLMSGQIPI